MYTIQVNVCVCVCVCCGPVGSLVDFGGLFRIICSVKKSKTMYTSHIVTVNRDLKWAIVWVRQIFARVSS